MNKIEAALVKAPMMFEGKVDIRERIMNSGDYTSVGWKFLSVESVRIKIATAPRSKYSDDKLKL